MQRRKHEKSEAHQMLMNAGANFLGFNGKNHPLYELNGLRRVIPQSESGNPSAVRNIRESVRKFITIAMARDSCTPLGPIDPTDAEIEGYAPQAQTRSLEAYATRLERATRRAEQQLEEATQMATPVPTTTETARSPHTCLTCGAGFETAKQLNSHKGNHAEPRFFCQLCTERFRRTTERDRHLIDVHHSPPSDRPRRGRPPGVGLATNRLVSATRVGPDGPVHLPRASELQAAIEMMRECLSTIEKQLGAWNDVINLIKKL
jgi:hypothetical protein